MLIDSFQRRHNYLRVSITDRCNLRCVYCMPEEGLECLPHHQILRNEEFMNLIGLFISMGIKKIRFTGGEPLVRKGFVDILGQTREMAPDVELAVTTNGVILGDYLDDFRRLGVNRINISLDTLQRDRYARLTRRDRLEPVLANIDSALGYGDFEVKLNAVLFDETLSELDDFIDYCLERDLVLRFIERMPFCESDRDAGFTSSDLLLEEFSKRGTLVRTGDRDSSVAHCYDLIINDDKKIHIGVIPPMTHKFCGSCNRLRLTSDGLLKTCLLSSHEYNLKDCMRSGSGEEEVRGLIMKALAEKGDGHHLDYTSQDGGCAPLANSRTMSKIGG